MQRVARVRQRQLIGLLGFSYYTVSQKNVPPLTCVSALRGKTEKHENGIFTRIYRISALPEFNQLLDSFNLSDSCRSWTVLHAQCTSALSSGFPISQVNAEAQVI